MKKMLSLFLVFSLCLSVVSVQANTLEQETLRTMVLLDAVSPGDSNVGSLATFMPSDSSGWTLTGLAITGSAATFYFYYIGNNTKMNLGEGSATTSAMLIAAVGTIAFTLGAASYNHLKNSNAGQAVKQDREVSRLVRSWIDVYNVDDSKADLSIDANEANKIIDLAYNEIYKRQAEGKAFTVQDLHKIVASQHVVSDRVLNSVAGLLNESISSDQNSALVTLKGNKRVYTQTQINLARELMKRLDRLKGQVALTDRESIQKRMTALGNIVGVSEKML